MASEEQVTTFFYFQKINQIKQDKGEWIITDTRHISLNFMVLEYDVKEKAAFAVLLL